MQYEVGARPSRTPAAQAKAGPDLARTRTLHYLGLLVGEVARSSSDLLTVALSYSELALGELPDGSPVRGWISEIRDAALRNEGLTQRLLSVSRRHSAELSLMTPQVAVLRCESRLRERLAAGQTLEIDNRTSCLVNADASLVELALELLVDNAVEALGGPGVLRLVLSDAVPDESFGGLGANLESRCHISIRLEDSGPGISPVARERIFEPFYSTKADPRHPGLGLAICDVIARMHGGLVHAPEVSRGACIELLFPCVGNEGEVFCPVDELLSQRPATVLLVEDEYPVRQLMRRILVQAGYEVLNATTAMESLELARLHRESIDLLLTDVVMPKLSGPELAARIREEIPDVGVLYVSGFAPEQIGDQRWLDASVDLLQKPFHPEDLLSRVRVAVQRCRRAGDQQPTRRS